ncbi:MAG: NifU family protein, partial [Acidimicrobiia bacterium]|nr:NifU family protein [Acidimicrobiia bacterium]
MDLLRDALDFVRPALQSDGGDLTLLGVREDGVVEIEMIGACRTCPLSMVTLTAGIEAVVLQRVPGATGVVSQLPQPVESSSAPSFSPAEALVAAQESKQAPAPLKPPRRGMGRPGAGAEGAGTGAGGGGGGRVG